MTINHVKTTSKEEFLALIDEVFGLSNTKLFDNETSLSVLLNTGNPNRNVMIGRMCKHSLKGTVMDRRSKDEGDTTLAARINAAPKRRGRDEATSG
jgi:hypothetical protein